MIAVVILSFLGACKKKDKNTGGGSVTGNELSVKINGSKKHFSDARARWIDGGNYLEITANNNGSEWISITIMSETTRVPEGQYGLDDGSAFTLLSTYSLINGSTQLNYAATRGTLAKEDAFTLHLNRINGSVEGTFSGVVVMVEGVNTVGMVTLEDGKFRTAILPN